MTVNQGEVYGLLGRNGAGKTTVMKMLLGLLSPTRGKSTLFGCSSQKLTPDIRARVGYLGEGHYLYGWMRIQELARFTKSTHPLWSEERYNAFMGYFDLDPKQHIKSLSNGQRAQVSLATALACQPELLIMDDPTLGVDAATRQDFLRGIVDLVSQENRTVLFSSHILADVERIADRIGIIDKGVLRVDIGLNEFKNRVARYHLEFPGDVPKDLMVPRQVSCTVMGSELSITVANPGPDVDLALAKLNATRCERLELSLEEAFVDYTSSNRKLRLSFADLSKESESTL